MKKKFFLILLAALVCITVLTATVFATETEAAESEETVEAGLTGAHVGGDYPYTWAYDPDTYTLSFTPTGKNTRLYTQGSGKGYGDLAEWKEAYPDYANAVQIIHVDDKFASIGWQHYSSAFANWPSVHTIYLGGITKTDSSGNEHNSNSGESYIRRGALFYNCPMLKTVYGSKSELQPNVVNLSQIYFSKSYTGTRINNTRYLLAGCKAVENVIFPTSIDKFVHVGMFYNCTALKSVKIPTWATAVKSNAFYNCKALTSITFPANITSIDATALTGCTGLTSIKIMSPVAGIPTIPTNANSETISITCASTAQYDALVALGRNDIEVTLEIPPANLMSDGSGYQYSYDKGVLTISKAETTSSTVLNRDIPLDFANKITTVIITEDTGITAIGDNVFNGFSAETVVIPSTVKTIGAAAFANMTALKTVVDYTAYTADNTAGAGIINLLTATSVSADAFSGSCAALSPVVYLGKTVAISGETLDWFAEDATETLYVYPSTGATTFFRENGIAFEYLTVDQTGDALLAREYSAWSIDTETGKLTWDLNGGHLNVGKNATAWPNWKAVWGDAIEYFFVENAKSSAYVFYQWNDSPFSNLPNVKHVHMDAIRSIRRSSYGTNGLFRNCPSLTTVSYGSDSEFDNVVDLTWWRKNDYMMNFMFYNCSSITKVILPTNLTKYDPESSSEIGVFSSMFNGCTGITEIEVPSCFITFYDNAFKGCNNLTSIKLSCKPLYYDLTAFPDQDGLTIDVANSFVASLFDDYNFTKTVVTYPQGEANSYFVEVAQPATNIIGDLSAIRPVETAAELEEICASETPVAAVLVDVDSSLNVRGLDMTVEELLKALEYRIFAAFKVSDSATVTALNSYLSSINFTDTYIIGAPELIKESYAINPYIHHIIDYTGVYTEALTAEDCVNIRREAHSNGAKIVYLPYSACSRDIIAHLYLLSTTVWIDMPESAGVAENYASVLSGAIGVVSEDTDEILDIACNKIAENTMARYPITSGHRGNETVCPENTLEGCLYAVNHGAQSVEIDIYITTDGEIVLMHDGTTKRTCNGNLTVEDSTLAQLKELYVNKGFENHELYSQCRIPTLNEIFEALKDYDVLINIEFKTTQTAAVDAVIALIEEYDMYGKCCFSSFRFDQFKRMHDKFPELPGIMLFRPILMQDYSADLNSIYVINTTGNYNANASLTNTNNVGGPASMAALIRRGVPVQSWSGTSAANKFMSGMHMIGDSYASIPNTLVVSGFSEEADAGTNETLSASYKDYLKNTYETTDVTYTIIDGADLATIDPATGVITYGDNDGKVSFVATYNYAYVNSSGTTVFEYSLTSDVNTVEILTNETILNGAQYKSEDGSTLFSWSFDTEAGVLTFTKGTSSTLDSSNSYPAYRTWRSENEAVLDEKLTKIVLVGFNTIQYQHTQSPLAGYASLTTIDLGGATTLQNSYSNSYGLFSDNPALTTIFANGGTAEGDAIGVVNLSKLITNTTYASNSAANANMFSGDKAITKVIMPESAGKCAYICPGMFNGCEALTEIEIPAYVTHIYENAFTNCKNLTFVNILGELSGSVAATAFPDNEELTIKVVSYNSAQKLDACEFTKTVVDYPFEGLVSMGGFNVRVASYNGLRGLFTADLTLKPKFEAEGYKLLEFGGIVSSAANRANCVLTSDGNGNYTTSKGIVKAEVWNSAEGIVGKYLPTSTSTKIDFAVTIINFAKENYMSDVYFCSYEVWTTPTGETTIIYKDYLGVDYDEVNLAGICNGMWSDGTITEEMDKDGILKDILDYYEENRTKSILFIGNRFTYFTMEI